MSASAETKERSRSQRGAAISFVFLAALAVAFFAAWPLIGEPGLLNTRGGGDSPFLLQRLQQMEAALRDGHFPVRWMGDANYGFGYPFFNYYAPLSIYIAALFRFLGFSLIRSIEVAQLLGFLAAAAGMFLLARRWLRTEWAALLASVAYTTAPFHLVNVYVRGDSLAEFWAMAFYPWVILTADRLLAAPHGRFPYGRILALSLAYAALILSHNISALIFTPFLLLFVLIRWFSLPNTVRSPVSARFSGRRLRTLLPVLAAGLLALALSAWFFLPALAEQHFAQLGPVTEGYFSYTNHFRGLDLVQTSALFDFDVAGGKAFRMGLVQAAAALAGSLALIAAAWRTRTLERGTALFILLTLAISSFLIMPLSLFLWDNLPLLPFTQFPWRFLSIQAFAASLAIGALALLPYCRVLSLTAAAILIVSSFAGLRTDHLLLTDGDSAAGPLAQYEWFSGNIGSTVSAEYLPQTVRPRPFTSAWLNQGQRSGVRTLAGDLLQVRQLEDRAARQEWSLLAGEQGASALFPVIAWPGWRVAVDGRPVELAAAPGSGLIQIQLPPGEHTVTLRLTRTPVRFLAELLSLAALIVALFLAAKGRRAPRIGRTALVAAGALALFLLLFRFWPQQRLSGDTLTWDFAQMAYLHHDQEGIPFSSGTTLISYEYDRDQLAAGENLAVTLFFSEANEDRLTLALGTPALTWPAFSPQPLPIAVERAPLDRRQITVNLPLPQNAPAGMLIPRLTMDVGRPLMPSGRPRGDLFLRPLRVTNQRPVVGGTSSLDVEAVGAQLRDSSTLDVQLAWSTQTPLSHNYNASLLLLDEAGSWLAQLDTQPGYGFLPSSEWTPGIAVDDWLALTLPQNLPRDLKATLVARLYEVESGDLVLTRKLGDLQFQGEELVFRKHQPVYSLPPAVTPRPALFDEALKLHGYQIEPLSESTWQLTLYWQAMQPGEEDAVRFVHLFDGRTEEILFQVDGHARRNSYPTSQWQQDEIVADTLLIQLDQVPLGDLQIGVGFYRQDGETFQRLPAVDAQNGQRIPDDRLVFPLPAASEPQP